MKPTYLIPVLLIFSGCSTPRFGADISMTAVSDRGLCQQLAVARFESEKNVYNVLMPKAAAREEAKAISAELKKRHPTWPWSDLDRGNIAVGMSEDQAVCSWGPPHQINRASYGDQWVYYRGGARAQYLYFKNGTLTAFN